jgi:putative ABC transport system permease protein
LKDQIEYTSSTFSGPALLSNGAKSHPVIAVGFEAEPYVRSLKQPALLEKASDWVLPWQKKHADMYLKNPDLIAITPVIADILSYHLPMEKTESAQLAARTLDGDLNAIDVEIGGEHSTGSRFLEETIVLVPLKKLQELFGTEGIQSISLYVNSNVNLRRFTSELNERIASLSFPLKAYTYKDEAINSIFEGTMSFLIVMTFFFVLLICSAVSLTIINALTMGIIERTREIGTLRAIGFTQKAVRQIFSRESLLVSLFAMVAGTILSFIIAKAVNAAEIKFQPPGTSDAVNFSIEWNMAIALSAGAVLTLVAWSSAQIVIRRKSKTKLILLLHDIGESE